MAEWILVLIAMIGAIAGPYVGFRVSEAVNKRRWVEMDDIVKRFQKHHEIHFNHATKVDTEMAAGKQQAASHEKRDDECFARIEAMFKEIRDFMITSNK